MDAGVPTEESRERHPTAADGDARARRPAAELIGRQPELRRLADLLAAARGGAGGAIVLRGVPGIGKSMLLSAVVSMATDGGDWTILSASGRQSESDLAFGTLSTLLRPLLDGLPDLPDVQARALAGAIGLAPAVPVERLTCHAAVLGLLAAAAGRQPVLVVADDLQWIDAASRDALLFCARRLPADRVAFAIAVRDDPASPRELGLPELAIDGLSATEADELLARAHPDLEREVGRRLWQGTAGNPLALLEIPRQAAPDSLSAALDRSEPLPLGEQLQAAFAERAHRLPEPTRRALLVAAASYTGGVDTILAALELVELSADALEAAEDDGLITLADGVLAWRHPLVRAAIYQTASAAPRRAAHAALARAGGEARLFEHRAWHLAAAATAPDEGTAAELERVGAEAARRGAPEASLQALIRAARLSPDEAQRARRQIAAAELALSVGRWPAALELLNEARGQTGDPRLVADSERIRARVEMVRGSPQAAHDRLVAIAETLAALDRTAAAATMTEAVLARTITGPLDAYRDTAQRAHALAEGVGGEVEAMAGVALGCALILNGETVAGLELFDVHGRSIAGASIGQRAPELTGMYACLHASIERFEIAERLFTSMLAGARERGAMRALPYPLSGRALLDLELGRWPAALAGAQEAVELSREMVGPGMLASSLAALAQVEAALGRAPETRLHAEESLSICKQLNAWAVEPEPVLALASLALSLGEHEAAFSIWRRTTVDIRDWVVEPGWEHLDDVMIEATLRAGHESQAERELDRLQAKADRTGRTWAHAVAARCRGLLATTGDVDACFLRALEWHERAPIPFARARTELCYGERLRRARRRSDAREQLERAAETFHRLGAREWAARADRELASAGYAHRTVGAESAWSGLTAAETRVAQVIVDGATYEEAARALIVSPRTIESHLRQIYRKVGVRSRSELTRRLAGGSLPL